MTQRAHTPQTIRPLRLRRRGLGIARGYTLVEILVSLAILAVLMASLMQATASFDAVLESQLRFLRLERALRSTGQTLEASLSQAGLFMNNVHCDRTNGFQFGVRFGKGTYNEDTAVEHYRRSVGLKNHTTNANSRADEVWVYRADPYLTFNVVQTPGTNEADDPNVGYQPKTGAVTGWRFMLEDAAFAYDATRCGGGVQTANLLCPGMLVVVTDHLFSDVFRIVSIENAGTNQGTAVGDIVVVVNTTDEQNKVANHRWLQDGATGLTNEYLRRYRGNGRTQLARFMVERYFVDYTNDPARLSGVLWLDDVGRFTATNIPARSMIAQNVGTMQMEVGIATSDVQTPYAVPVDFNEYRNQFTVNTFGPQHIVAPRSTTTPVSGSVFGLTLDRAFGFTKTINFFLMMRLPNAEYVNSALATASEVSVLDATGTKYSALGTGYIADYALTGTNDGIGRRLLWKYLDLQNAGYGESLGGALYEILVSLPGARSCP